MLADASIQKNDFRFTRIIPDPEVRLQYLEYDYVVLGELRSYLARQEKRLAWIDSDDRLRLIVQYSLGVMKSRIAEAKEEFRAIHPNAAVLSFYCNHLDEETLLRYFTGGMALREMSDLEAQCRYCAECAWEFIGVGRAVSGFTILFECDHLVSPLVVRTTHLDGEEIDAWLERKQSRGQRREVLEHLKICRRCRARMRREVKARRRMRM